PTEGETDIPAILNNVNQAAPADVRLFAFGVGDDVDTVLLDSLVQDHHGTSAYVRPGERLDEAVSALYVRVATPVLTDVSLNVDLSVRYGIVTPYTSYLITDDNILTEEGRNTAAAQTAATATEQPSTGAVAVDEAAAAGGMAGSDKAAAPPQNAQTGEDTNGD